MSIRRILSSEISFGIVIALIVIGFLIFPVIYIILYITNVYYIRMLKLIWLSIIMLFIHLLALVIIYPSYSSIEYKSKERLVKDNTHLIENSVNNYLLDKNTLPLGVEELINTGYLDSMPMNPFTKNVTKIIKFKEPDYPGNITYIPVFQGSLSNCYYLLAYGGNRTMGEDVDQDGNSDHIILICSNCSIENISMEVLKKVK
jgi:competence protein ComGC